MERKPISAISLKISSKMCGGGTLSFLPPVSSSTIGYAQSRRFILIDLKEESFRQFLVCKRLEENINRVAIADAGKLMFLFEILAFSDDPTDTSDPDRILRMVDLSSGSDTLSLKGSCLPMPDDNPPGNHSAI